MPVPLNARGPLARAAGTADGRPLTGMWLSAGSPTVADVCAGSGVDVLLVDGEHGPNDLPTVLAQLQVVRGRALSVVRLPIGDPVLVKQHLELRPDALLVPMVDSAEQAAGLVRAASYPPEGSRGVGSALSRAGGWGRDGGYLAGARDTFSLLVQIESAAAVDAVGAIAAVDGVDGLFLGPADLAGSLGLLGQQQHPDVVAAVEHCLAAARGAGKLACVNAFDPATARRYAAAGAHLVSVGADVTLLARGSDALARLLQEDTP